MGFATACSPCGCSHTLLMESGRLIEYRRCADHYVPKVDDKKILEAAQNKRQYEKEIWDKANEVFHQPLKEKP